MTRDERYKLLEAVADKVTDDAGILNWEQCYYESAYIFYRELSDDKLAEAAKEILK